MPNLQGPGILIIDDEEANRYAVGRMLTKSGYRVTEAKSWKEGSAYIEKKPDLVILDVQLPDANGFEVCRDLKADPATQSLPVLMTSASFIKSRDKAQGLDAGADGYLTTPIDPLELIATIRALLRIRETEEQLRIAYDKAEAANAAKTSFLANMSHEIRTPMNVIMGVAEILSRTPLNERQTECVSTLQLSAKALLDLINDVLDIARIENKSLELEVVPFDVRKLIKDVMSMMTIKADERGIALKLVDQLGENAEFLGDPTRLQQVLLNLVSNAVKFTSQGSVVVTMRESVGATNNARQLNFEIADTGIGISSEKLDLIFDKFTQGDLSTTRKYGGSGLGLAICKALLKKMGGTIRVVSELEKGSTFTITIPLPITVTEEQARQPAERRLSPGPTNSDENEKVCILIVEDYPANILVTTTFLDDLGYHYDTALNGNEAMKKVNSGAQYGAILMDIQMQGMDGYQTTRLIRERESREHLARVPIIAMTAHAMSGEAQRCVQAGMDDYISKPYRLADLQTKLNHYLKP